MRSSFSSPVFLSNSYLTLEPVGISTTAINSAGSFSPGVTSCQGCDIADLRSQSYARPTGGRAGDKSFESAATKLDKQEHVRPCGTIFARHTAQFSPARGACGAGGEQYWRAAMRRASGAHGRVGRTRTRAPIESSRPPINPKRYSG